MARLRAPAPGSSPPRCGETPGHLRDELGALHDAGKFCRRRSFSRRGEAHGQPGMRFPAISRRLIRSGYGSSWSSRHPQPMTLQIPRARNRSSSSALRSQRRSRSKCRSCSDFGWPTVGTKRSTSAMPACSSCRSSPFISSGSAAQSWPPGCGSPCSSAAAIFANVYPLRIDSHTLLPAAVHLPIALWLAVGFAYVGNSWFADGSRMSFVRFSGELVIYDVLIALGGGVLTGFTLMMFSAIQMDAEWFVQGWLIPCGVAGATSPSLDPGSWRRSKVSSRTWRRLLNPARSPRCLQFCFSCFWPPWLGRAAPCGGKGGPHRPRPAAGPRSSGWCSTQPPA